MDISKLLLKNGIKEMVSENETYFKNNIEKVLALKLNDSIFSVRESVCAKLFEENKTVENSENLYQFINFVTNFKPGNFLFEDGSVININEKEKELVKKLFESLNSENKTKMIQEIFKNGSVFKQHVSFAKTIGN